MDKYQSQFIDGEWVAPSGPGEREMVNPATEEVYATVVNGATVQDVDRAVSAARRAFRTFSKTTKEERIALIDRIIEAYEERIEEFADVIALEVGIPRHMQGQVTSTVGHMKVARDLVRSYETETRIGDTIVRREPIGVCGLISPWNWPIQTLAIKFIYAIAAGCTSVAKTSDASPISAIMLAEVLEKAGTPKGVYNLVLGRGSVVGEALSSHPDVDFISFTGSTRAGARVGEAAARTVKRVCLELGGKSASVVLPDADLEMAARGTIGRSFSNTGQSCHAPSRLLVHEDQLEEIIPFLVAAAESYVIGDPLDPATTLGPMVHKEQYDTVQGYIQAGLDEGARLVAGGLGRQPGHDRGYFARPTVFVDVHPDMRIAREEIFGPVESVITYKTVEEAIEIANDSIYGLGGYVYGEDRQRGYEVASALRAGRIWFNGSAPNQQSPMGGYKQSGVGRSMGVFGLEEYLEVKSVFGFGPESQGLPELHR